MIFKSDGKGTDLNGFLDRGSHLRGELTFETTFRVDGRFSGTVKSDGDLIIGEAGEVEGEIEVGQIFVSGSVHGTIAAAKKVEITPTGKVFANITTPTLVVGNGALLEGHCVMSRKEGGRSAKAQVEAAPAPKVPEDPQRTGTKEPKGGRKTEGGTPA